MLDSVARFSHFLMRKSEQYFPCFPSRRADITSSNPAAPDTEVTQTHQLSVIQQQDPQPPHLVIPIPCPVSAGQGVAVVPCQNTQRPFDLGGVVIGFCLTSAVEIALQLLQPQNIKIPLLVHLLSVALVFAFSSFFVSTIISGTDHPRFSRALHQVGKFSVFFAFFLAITVPFPLFFKIMLWSVCVLSLLPIAYVVAARGRLSRFINFLTGSQNQNI